MLNFVFSARFRVRKEGKGPGGWEENEPATEFPVEGVEADHTATPSVVEGGSSPKEETKKTPEQMYYFTNLYVLQILKLFIVNKKRKRRRLEN